MLSVQGLIECNSIAIVRSRAVSWDSRGEVNANTCPTDGGLLYWGTLPLILANKLIALLLQDK